jgi:uncharacterized protein YndB with AHSA1/START domain
VYFETSLDIHAAPETVWAILTDVERWPTWTASMTSVRRLDNGTFAAGSAARVKQPRLPAATWRVTEMDPERSFTWVASSGGVTTIAAHRITVHPDGVAVSLSIRQAGLLAWLVGLFTASMTRRYVQMELDGLSRSAEGQQLSEPEH